MSPCEGDNDCYHECEEAEADSGHILQCHANKEGQEKRRTACLNSTNADGVHREGVLVKYTCQHVVF